MTLEELNKIRQTKRELVAVRKVVKEQGEKLAAKTGYRNRFWSAAAPDVLLPAAKRCWKPSTKL